MYLSFINHHLSFSLMKALRIKKGDIAVTAIVLLAALAGLAVLVWLDSGAAAGLRAEIYMDGELIQSVALPAKEQRIEIWRENPAGCNILQISPQGIMMLEASCQNQDCVHCGLKSRPGSVIACLPHRLLVRLSGVKDGAFDAITY